MFMLLSVACIQDDQEFNPTASFLCKSTSGTFHLNFIFAEIMAPLLQGLERSDLALVHVHHISSQSNQQLIHDSFLLSGYWKKWSTLAHVTLWQETVSYPYGHFHYYFNLILDVTYHQNFASLGTSTSHMANITFPFVNLTESTHQPCHTLLYLLWICPCKILLFITCLKNQNVHTSCLTVGNNNDSWGMSPVKIVKML